MLARPGEPVPCRGWQGVHAHRPHPSPWECPDTRWPTRGGHREDALWNVPDPGMSPIRFSGWAPGAASGKGYPPRGRRAPWSRRRRRVTETDEAARWLRDWTGPRCGPLGVSWFGQRGRAVEAHPSRRGTCPVSASPCRESRWVTGLPVLATRVCVATWCALCGRWRDRPDPRSAVEEAGERAGDSGHPADQVTPDGKKGGHCSSGEQGSVGAEAGRRSPGTFSVSAPT
jgi:hypothetical protein